MHFWECTNVYKDCAPLFVKRHSTIECEFTMRRSASEGSVLSCNIWMHGAYKSFSLNDLQCRLLQLRCCNLYRITTSTYDPPIIPAASNRGRFRYTLAGDRASGTLSNFEIDGSCQRPRCQSKSCRCGECDVCGWKRNVCSTRAAVGRGLGGFAEVTQVKSETRRTHWNCAFNTLRTALELNTHCPRRPARKRCTHTRWRTSVGR